MRITRQAMQIWATETAKSRGETKLKLGDIGATSLCTMKDCQSGIERPSVERFQLIFKRTS
jgi:hypothetical protein